MFLGGSGGNIVVMLMFSGGCECRLTAGATEAAGASAYQVRLQPRTSSRSQLSLSPFARAFEKCVFMPAALVSMV
jgi:hypothetical protein